MPRSDELLVLSQLIPGEEPLIGVCAISMEVDAISECS